MLIEYVILTKQQIISTVYNCAYYLLFSIKNFRAYYKTFKFFYIITFAIVNIKAYNNAFQVILKAV